MPHFFTLQSKEVIDIVQKQGIYYPDFDKSLYLNNIPELRDLYDRVLSSFNYHNHTNLNGLIFSFLWQDDIDQICDFYDIEDFQEKILLARDALLSVWRFFVVQDYKIISVNADPNLAPIFIDLNDFQFLMPPLYIIPPYTENSVYRLLRNIDHAAFETSEYPSGLIQAHLPYIKKDDVTGIYDIFPIE